MNAFSHISGLFNRHSSKTSENDSLRMGSIEGPDESGEYEQNIAVLVSNLRKIYGETAAVDGLSFCVPKGEVRGFLGPNGAGKTTTLRILLGLAKPTSGRVEIFNEDVVKAGNSVRKRIGFLPDVPGFPTWMTAREFLHFSGALFSIPEEKLKMRIDSLLELAGLLDVRHKIGNYSRGMKQRLGIAQALISAPDLLILDEPTSALDPMGRKEVLDMICALRGKATVLFSTHVLNDVERVCDSATIINKGRVVAEGAITDLRAKYAGAHVVHLRVENEVEKAQDLMQAQPWCKGIERKSDGALHIKVDSIAEANGHIADVLSGAGLHLVEYGAQSARFEDIFVRLTNGEE